jgi:hypothetical protein
MNEKPVSRSARGTLSGSGDICVVASVFILRSYAMIFGKQAILVTVEVLRSQIDVHGHVD